jgi:hypothetical protein
MLWCYIGALVARTISQTIRQSYSGELTYIYPNPILILAAGRLPRHALNSSSSQLHLSQQHRHTSTKPVTAVKVEQ